MPDRLSYAIDYARQDFWTLPCDKEKHASIKWVHLQRRPMTTQERHAGWPNRSDRNIALICGRRAGLLVLTVNVKNGHDGHATLKRLGWDRIIPPTPTILTPSGGRALCFKVPGPDFSQFVFNTHVHPDGYDGLEFRGGDDHYQLVPPSRTPDGAYTFVRPWTLKRLRADLADLPGEILQVWVMLDRRGAKIFARDEPETIGKPRKHPPAAAVTTNLSPPPPTQTRRSHTRSTLVATATPPSTPTITTVLTTENSRVLVDGFDVYERECAEVLCSRMDLSGDTLDAGVKFRC